MRCSRFFLAVAALWVVAIASGGQVRAQAAVNYPLVFADRAHLAKLGIVEESFGAGQASGFRNKCHYYGDGGYSVSVSDEFLSAYVDRGFSLNSLCLGLVSGIRFDPETGKRLPTYIVADLEELAKLENPEEAEPGILSDELPLIVPDCFKRGVPLSDCAMKFDLLTGDSLSESRRKALKGESEALVNFFRKDKAAGAFQKQCSCEQDSAMWGPDEVSRDALCYRETLGECEDEEVVVGRLARENYGRMDFVGFVDVSPSLPLGIGYALYADGAAGPSPDEDSVEAAKDGKLRATDATIEAVKVDLGGN